MSQQLMTETLQQHSIDFTGQPSDEIKNSTRNKKVLAVVRENRDYIRALHVADGAQSTSY